MLLQVEGDISFRELDTPLRFNSPNIGKVFALGHDGVNSFIVLEDAGLSHVMNILIITKIISRLLKKWNIGPFNHKKCILKIFCKSLFINGKSKKYP